MTRSLRDTSLVAALLGTAIAGGFVIGLLLERASYRQTTIGVAVVVVAGLLAGVAIDRGVFDR